MGIFDKKNIIKVDNEDLKDAKLSTSGFAKNIKKRAFLNVLAARIAMKMLFDQDIKADNVYSLYTIQNILKRFDISDIYCGSTKLDIRIVFNKEQIFIPKFQFENAVTPDLYLFFELASDLSSAEFLGLISPENVNKSNSNDSYYFVEMKDLIPPENLAKSISSINKKSRENIPEAEAKAAKEQFLSLTDGELSEKNMKQLLGLLANSYSLREVLVEFENFELISTKVAEDSSILKDDVLGVVGAQNAYEDENQEPVNDKAEIIDEVLTSLIETEEMKSEQKASGMTEALAAGAAAGITAGAVGALAAGASEALDLSDEIDSAKDFLEELADNSTLSNENKNENDESKDSDKKDIKLENDLSSEEGSELLELEGLSLEPEELEQTVETITSLEEIPEESEISAKPLKDIGFEDVPVRESSDDIIPTEEGILPEGNNVGYVPADIKKEDENNDEELPEMSFTETKTDEANSIFADADIPFEGLPELSLNYDNEVPEYMKNIMGGQEPNANSDSEENTETETLENGNILDESLPIYNNETEETPSSLVEETEKPFDIIEEETDDNVEKPVIDDVEPLTIQSEAIPPEEQQSIDDTEAENIQPVPTQEQETAYTKLPGEPDETDSFISEIDNFLNEIDYNDNSDQISEAVENPQNNPLQVLYKESNEDEENTNEEEQLDEIPSSQSPSGSKKAKIIAASIAVILVSAYAINNFGKQAQNVPADNAALTQMQQENEQRRKDEFNQSLPVDSMENTIANANSSQSIEESMTHAFYSEPVNASISKIAWEVPEKYAYNDAFRQYLLMAGKNLKLNLQNELLVSDNLAYSDKVIVNIVLSKDGTLQNSTLVRSSGSKGIDKIVLQSVKTTLNYLKLPNNSINGNSVEATLIISF